MATLGQQQQQPTNYFGTVQQTPYNINNSMLMNNTPFENYMGRPMQQTNQFLKCRPVSSKEEAMAFQIDLDGSLWVFPCISGGRIYTKQINNDGTATFNTYVFTEDKNLDDSNNYVTKNEFNQVIQTIMAALPQNNAAPAQSNNESNQSKNIAQSF